MEGEKVKGQLRNKYLLAYTLARGAGSELDPLIQHSLACQTRCLMDTVKLAIDMNRGAPPNGDGVMRLAMSEHHYDRNSIS
jgi:hypothetical protein